MAESGEGHVQWLKLPRSTVGIEEFSWSEATCFSYCIEGAFIFVVLRLLNIGIVLFILKAVRCGYI
jgi:hypothetical protein